jgi:hypothetical protein
MNTRMKNLTLRGLIVGTSVLLAAWSIQAQQFVFEASGNSSYQPGQLMPDPTGGLAAWNVLVFDLPFAGVAGDLLIDEGSLNGTLVDIIRFDGNSHLIFYSSSANGFHEAADVPAPPNPLFPNLAYAVEYPSAVDSYADYVPSSGQPGYDLLNPAYHFSEVPEPGAGVLVALGAGLMLVVLRRPQR